MTKKSCFSIVSLCHNISIPFLFSLEYAVLWRKADFRIRKNTHVKIRPCWFCSPWLPFPLLLPILWGDNLFPHFLVCWFSCEWLKFNSVCVQALFPFEDWWVVPAKVSFDQTVWAAVWNSIYYFVLGLLRFESPAYILSELKATFWPLLTVRNSSSFSIH